MGTGTSEERSSWIKERYRYIETTHIQQYGMISIFKKREENYDYIALMSKRVGRQYMKEIERELTFLTSKKQQLPFLKVFQLSIGEQQLINSTITNKSPPQHRSICSHQQQTQSIGIYLQLLTFTLKEHICFKQQSKYQISVKEYSYIMKTVLSAAKLYQEWKFTYLELDIASELIFIKPNGQIKMMPFHCRLLKEDVNDCECFPCKGTNNPIIKKKHSQCQINSYITLKKKESKYLKQIKQLSLQLFSTINPNIDPYVRSIPHFNRDIFLSSYQLDLLRQTQSCIIEAKSLSEIYQVLRDIEDEFLIINGFEQNTAEIQISNPEAYQAFIQHLSTINSFKKQPELKEKSYRNVSRRIFDNDLDDSEDNTFSYPSPKPNPNAHQQPQIQYFK